ncbi:MAG: hypothetical protein AB1500_00645 [Bacillota bacterium]
MLTLLLGILFVLLTAFCGYFLWFIFRFKRQQDFDAHFQEAVTVEELDLEGRLVNIGSQLETLTAICMELKERLQGVERQAGEVLRRQSTVRGELSPYEMVYKAFERGKKVTELARDFGRSKGEIELMLNLREIKKKEG